MLKRSLSSLSRDLMSYGNRPEKDNSSPVTFSEIAKQYPMAMPSSSDAAIGVSHFAELGFCPYKSFHHGRGTEKTVTPEAVLALKKGTEYHEKMEAADRAFAEALPEATLKQLRNPSIDIAEIPELRASIRSGQMFYMSSIERAGRLNRNLTIREIKTGRFIGGSDHLLQTWGYCVSAPGILSANGIVADQIEWQVDYPHAGKKLGPFIFSERALSLLLEAMEQFEALYSVGKAGSGITELVPVNPAKCRQCAFVADCRWAKVSESYGV